MNQEAFVTSRITVGTLQKFINLMRTQVVCAQGSLSIQEGVQNLIICVKTAWSEHLWNDCGNEYSLVTL